MALFFRDYFSEFTPHKQRIIDDVMLLGTFRFPSVRRCKFIIFDSDGDFGFFCDLYGFKYQRKEKVKKDKCKIFELMKIKINEASIFITWVPHNNLLLVLNFDVFLFHKSAVQC